MKQFKKNVILFVILLSFFFINCYYQYINYLKKWFESGGHYAEGPVYLAILGLINTFALLLFFIHKSFYSFLLCLGSVFFWYSDFILTKLMFSGEEIYHGNFVVMLTYLIAQTSIAIGMSKQE